jgi:CDP-glycerol glycerophosphotransferase (TagB/SpsB family)
MSEHQVKKQILVMPTMRGWICDISSDTDKYESSRTIEDSEFFKSWKSFLEDRRLHTLLMEKGVKLIFYPHARLQKYLSLFQVKHEQITIAGLNEFDVQSLLMESAMLITDYSSVYFDFAYMQKPLIYYQFDYEKYRRGQYQEGYFSYKDDGFGVVVENATQLIHEIRQILELNCVMEPKYKNRVNNFFTFNDKCNCERTF